MLKTVHPGTVVIDSYIVPVHTDDVVMLELDLAHKRCEVFSSVLMGPDEIDQKVLFLLVTDDTPNISEYERENAGMLATHVELDPETFRGFDIFCMECSRYTVRVSLMRRGCYDECEILRVSS